VQLGTCECLLSELVYRENLIAESLAQKGAVIEKHLNVVPAPGFTGSLAMRTEVPSLGSLRIKMRLRKPIQEAMRYYRDMTEVRDTTRSASAPKAGKDRQGPKQAMVTINIVGGRDLKVRDADVTYQIAPFFYYQFFTFDESYSHTATGTNPTFQDARSYTMVFDDGTMKYLETQSLDVILFDDAAPMTGIERGGQASGGAG